MPDKRYKKVLKKLNQETSKLKEEFKASSIEGKVIENLKLLKSLIRGEKVSLKHFQVDQDQKATDTISELKSKISDDLLNYPTKELASFVIPKRYQEDCLDLLTDAWRKKIQKSYPTTLTFSSLSFSNDSFRAFIMALTLNVSLKALNLKKCKLGDIQIKFLALLIRIHPTLEYLHLENQDLSENRLSILTHCIIESISIQNIGFKSCLLNDKNFNDLKKLTEFKNLKSLHLEENELSQAIEEELEKVDSLCKVYFI